MFNSVQYVRDLCKARKIPVSQLEKDCGFSNGYLNPKKMTRLPYDRARIIGQYLGVSVNTILGEDPRSQEDRERSVSDAELKFALWGDCQDMDEHDLADVRRYAAFVRERKKEQK